MGHKSVFISMPMFGRSDVEIAEDRIRAEEAVRDIFSNCNIDFIEPLNSDVTENKGRVFCLGASIQMLERADFVYFCRDWEFANGCRVEKKVCDLYGIPYFFERDA